MTLDGSITDTGLSDSAMRFDGKEKWPGLMALTCGFSVELPGLEPATEIALTGGNAEFEYEKRR